MEPKFWQERWRQGRIGFHQDCVTPLLEQYWESLALPPGSRVFVPLAGKSRDLAWLASQGHRVLGVELSPLAVEQFFAEHGLTPATRDTRYGRHYLAAGAGAGSIELICGNVFGLDAELLSSCTGVFDRAALVALPPDLRRRYADDVYARLPAGCRGLLITFEYAQNEMAGPPFSVSQAEIRALYGQAWTASVLTRQDTLAQQPKFAAAGLAALATVAYRMERRASS